MVALYIESEIWFFGIDVAGGAYFAAGCPNFIDFGVF